MEMTNKLYEWCLEQREAYQNGELTSKQIKMLENINFIFYEKDALRGSLFYCNCCKSKSNIKGLERIN